MFLSQTKSGRVFSLASFDLLYRIFKDRFGSFTIDYYSHSCLRISSHFIENQQNVWTNRDSSFDVQIGPFSSAAIYQTCLAIGTSKLLQVIAHSVKFFLFLSFCLYNYVIGSANSSSLDINIFWKDGIDNCATLLSIAQHRSILFICTE